MAFKASVQDMVAAKGKAASGKPPAKPMPKKKYSAAGMAAALRKPKAEKLEGEEDEEQC